jgi:AcrR family transcriptional regulator
MSMGGYRRQVTLEAVTAQPRSLKPRPRGRPPVISRQAILDAAGTREFSKLTLAALATDLGVTPSALYRYFPSKEHLAQALREHRSALVPVPPRDERPWQDWLRDAAMSLRDYIACSLGPDGALPDDIAVHPLVSAIAETLDEAGFTPTQSFDLYTQLCSFAVGSAMFERRFAQVGPLTKAGYRAHMRDNGVDKASTLAAMFQPLIDFDVMSWFGRQVSLAVHAHEQLLASSSPGTA